MSDRAGDVQVTFVFHISRVGVSVFSLLKKSVDGDITNIPLVPSFGVIGVSFLICQVLTPDGSKAR